MRTKTKTYRDWSAHVFPAFRTSIMYLSSYDWLAGLSVKYLIGYCVPNNFSFGYKTLN